MNKNNSTKLLSLLLVAIFALFILSGCVINSSKTSNQEVTTEGSSKTTAATPKERMKISFASVLYGPLDKNSVVETELEKIFPQIDLELLGFEVATYFDQLTMRIAGGDIPDIMHVTSKGQLAQLVKQGVLSEIPYKAIKENMPQYFKASEKFGLEVYLATTINDKNYGIPYLNESQTHPFTNGWRMDWLENVGIDKVPETLEEMEAAFVKFVNNDPDKNGQKDTFGFTLRGKDAMLNSAGCIFGAFGVFANFWNKSGDGVQYGITMPQAKSALELLNKWYKMGIIDPEFPTTDWNIVKQKWFNEKVGYLDMGTYYRWIPGGELYEGMKAVNPNAKIAMAPAPKGPNGDYGYFNWGKITGCIAFGKDTANNKEKLANIFAFLERLSTDKEVNALAFLGIEGVHWKRDPNTANGPVKIPPYNEAKNCGSVGTNFSYALFTPEVVAYRTRTDEPELYKYAVAGTVKDNEDYFTWVDKLIPAEISTKYGSSLNTLVIKNMIDFITGVRPLDEFDQFVNEWKAAGGAELTKAANEAYKNGDTIVNNIIKAINN